MLCSGVGSHRSWSGGFLPGHNRPGAQAETVIVQSLKVEPWAKPSQLVNCSVAGFFPDGCLFPGALHTVEHTVSCLWLRYGGADTQLKVYQNICSQRPQDQKSSLTGPHSFLSVTVAAVEGLQVHPSAGHTCHERQVHLEDFIIAIFLCSVIHHCVPVLGFSFSGIKTEWLKITWLITFSFSYNYWSKPAGMTREGRGWGCGHCSPARRRIPTDPPLHGLFASVYSFFLLPHPVVLHLHP